MQSCLPSAAAAIRPEESPEPGTPAGTVVVRAAGLRVHGGTVTAEGQVPSAGELALFCRPVVTAPAVVRRSGGDTGGRVASGPGPARRAGKPSR